jgi:hypothetical protein
MTVRLSATGGLKPMVNIHQNKHKYMYNMFGNFYRRNKARVKIFWSYIQSIGNTGSRKSAVIKTAFS